MKYGKSSCNQEIGSEEKCLRRTFQTTTFEESEGDNRTVLNLFGVFLSRLAKK